MNQMWLNFLWKCFDSESLNSAKKICLLSIQIKKRFRAISFQKKFWARTFSIFVTTLKLIENEENGRKFLGWWIDQVLSTDDVNDDNDDDDDGAAATQVDWTVNCRHHYDVSTSLQKAAKQIGLTTFGLD